MILASRYHDISCGHRVVGHENKCRHLHGHNYRIIFNCASLGNKKLDSVGRVIDFGVIKERLCQWLEDNWDHKFLMWEKDPLVPNLQAIHEMMDPTTKSYLNDFADSFVYVPFNPTAENMAIYLVEVVGPQQLEGTGCGLMTCSVRETAKCGASYMEDLS